MTVIPFTDLKSQYSHVKREVNTAIKRVINNAQFIGGLEVEKFEKEFARYLKVKYVIGINSGTDALIIGIRGLNLKTNDEVIVPANTFIATALAVSENGARPVFVDIDENDFGINLDDLKNKINEKTKAIILVHLYGQPDKIDEIKEIIKNTGRKIHIIEDACQAHGAIYKGKRVGNFGIFSAFSFYPTKNLGAYGDGGAIVTNDHKLAEKYRLLRQYGSDKKYFHKTFGVNSRLDTLQAAVLGVKLKYLDNWNKKRQAIANLYTKYLNKMVPEVNTPNEFSDRKSVFHIYLIRTKKRNKLANYLKKRGVLTLIHYPLPLHLQKAYDYLGYKYGDFPNTEKASEEILSLPMYEYMTEKQIQYVVKSIEEFYKVENDR
ncbi:MAG: pyridoxal phosphate-dependent protein [Parcubacteria group bacterium GW2011_GWA2_31_28]|nr:MAG: pyridoxal phosphate-dependent protein [Parcubacteria group bacterium GW2011_GWA2_31_28]